MACSLADALHALTCFAGDNTCTCPPSPSPEQGPTVGGSTVLRAVADARSIKAGSEVQVRIFVDEPLEALFGYQLTAVVSGGRKGSLDLVDIAIEDRRDAVYAPRSPRIAIRGSDQSAFTTSHPSLTPTAALFQAFNVETAQMLAGNFDGPVSTPADGYLATFTYRASADAVGTFVIDIVRGDVIQTLLVGADQNEQIVVSGTRPAVIVVTAGSARSVR